MRTIDWFVIWFVAFAFIAVAVLVGLVICLGLNGVPL